MTYAPGQNEGPQHLKLDNQNMKSDDNDSRKKNMMITAIKKNLKQD